jgi:hypothetical protein
MKNWQSERSLTARVWAGSMVGALAGLWGVAIAPGSWASPVPAIVAIPPYRDLMLETNPLHRRQSSFEQYGNATVYRLHQAGIPPLDVVVERGGDRVLLVDRTRRQGRKLANRGQVVRAVEVVGLPSRVFPGLVGVQAIPPETVPQLSP